MKIWELQATGNNNLGVAPGDLRYFHDHFVGTPMVSEWELPPLEILGKKKKLRDFVSWSAQAPLVSLKAKKLIEELCGDDVELLQFHDLNGKPYFALNVLRVEDYVDLRKCETTKYNSGELINIVTYCFREDLPEILPIIFKEPLCLNTIFVTEAFAAMVVKNKLTGLALADPSVNQLSLAIHEVDSNVVPGIIT